MRRLALTAAGIVLLVLAGLRTGATGAGEAPEPDPLTTLGHSVSSGAAPGYVDSKLCGLCHQETYRSYQDVGMFQSFYRPATAVERDRSIEDFEAEPYDHEASGRSYRIERREGGGLLFRRWQTDPSGERIHEIEIPVDWIMGSGYHARVYLYRNPMGELFQLPLAWYTQENDGRGAWAMAPGYDRPDHEGVIRRVRRECMFCHNAYPDVPEGSDAYGAPHTFPEDLPEGTGCQRCHGPGAEHVRRALAGDATQEDVRSAIVDPGRLEPALRDSVCYECHMQPSVAISGVRRFGRGDYSFRPGELLDEFRVQLDVSEADQEREERFEINHHPYRLEQSPCFRATGGALSCLTCHDPHRKVPAEERAAHYRAACLGCHEDLAHPAAAPSGSERTDSGASGDPFLTGDCTACHMPKRRTRDVVHAIMTDHRITRDPPPPAELLAPLEESEPVITGLHFLRPERAPEGALGEVYRAVGALRAGDGADAADHLAANLARARPEATEPWLELAKAQLHLQRFDPLEGTLRAVLERDPGNLRAREWLGIALSGQGRREEAIETLRGVVEQAPDRPEPRVNLGMLLLGQGQATGDAAEVEEAVEHLRRVTELRSNQVVAWYSLGTAHLMLERYRKAAEALRQSLALDPSRTRSYLRLADALLAMDRREEALRYLRHGTTVARQPEAVRSKLEKLEP